MVAALLVVWLINWSTPNHSAWIHVLPFVAALTAVLELRTKPGRNIEARSTSIPNWDPAQPERSLTEIHLYVLEEAVNSTKWYWQHKGAKALGSQIIRFAVWALATLGGLLPIGAVVLKGYFQNLALTKGTHLDLTNGLWASLLLGLAAGLLGLDKGFGFSSGWARYVLAGTNIRKSLEDFRLDWAALRLKAGTSLTDETVSPLIARAKLFRAEVEGLVLQETKDWVTEFQSTMAQMEKDVAAQLSSLKAQVEKTVSERAAAIEPGFVRLTLKDPSQLFAKTTLTATLIDADNQAVKGVQQQPITSPIWTSPFVNTGFYQLKIQGTVNNVPFLQTRSVTVKSRAEAAPDGPDVELK
jgi:conflict system pore-forming effector with SLATT domain